MPSNFPPPAHRNTGLRYACGMSLAHDPVPLDRLRPLKRVEYERLAELGAFRDEKVELVYGRIIRMSPIGGPHRYGVSRLNELLVRALEGRARVEIQMSFAASDDSEPEPDVAVVPLGDYLEAPPSVAFLLIEVAQSSLADDRGWKATLYAACGVPEYWIVNLVDDVIEVYREPGAEGYARVTRHGREEELRVPGFEDVVVHVCEVLPPRK
jgi:Uma2 family endonuclease